jgi:hypothetical protein
MHSEWQGNFLPPASGVLMLAIFALNAYIGLKDTVLFKLQPAHQTLNFIIAAIDLLASAFLLYYLSGNQKYGILLAGVIWPVIYLLSLLADVESRLCLFTGNNCFASVQIAYEYLILGQSAQGWILWPFTMLSVISLLFAIIILSAIYLLINRKRGGRRNFGKGPP